MSKPLTKQELHNLAMNIVGKELEAKGYEFLSVNSQLKRHPQFVCINKNNDRYFVIVKANVISDTPITFDVIWMETFKKHARTQQAKVIFAGVGFGNVEDKSLPTNLNEAYLLQYDGLQFLDVEQN